jgi:hypothetical protein
VISVRSSGKDLEIEIDLGGRESGHLHYCYIIPSSWNLSIAKSGLAMRFTFVP